MRRTDWREGRETPCSKIRIHDKGQDQGKHSSQTESWQERERPDSDGGTIWSGEDVPLPVRTGSSWKCRSLLPLPAHGSGTVYGDPRLQGSRSSPRHYTLSQPDRPSSSSCFLQSPTCTPIFQDPTSCPYLPGCEPKSYPIPNSQLPAHPSFPSYPHPREPHLTPARNSHLPKTQRPPNPNLEPRIPIYTLAPRNSRTLSALR